MTAADLARWEALCAAATPPPWHAPGLGEVHADHDGGVVCPAPRDPENPEVVSDLSSDADAEFIAASRAAVPALIAEVRTLRAEAGHAEDGVLVGQVRIARTGNWWRDAEGIRHECRALEQEMLRALEMIAAP